MLPEQCVDHACGGGGEAHFVRFYDDEAFLAEEIAAHLGGALRRGGSAILIATAARVEDVLALLRRDVVPDDLAHLVVLDAAATLAQFTMGGWPDAARFDAVVGALVRAVQRPGVPTHAYGEMVALLCADGHFEAALRLEELWNALRAHATFSLFCAYPWALFPTVELADSFASICRAHTDAGALRQACHRHADPLERLELERRALALGSEAARRRDAERLAADTQADLADFLDNAAEGIHRVGPDGTILWANKAELALLGYRWEEYVGHNIAEFHADADVIERILDILGRGGTLYDQPARLRCRDGGIRHVVIHSNGCFENGQLRYTRCFTRDATQRHERDMALAQRDQMILRSPVATALLSGPGLRIALVNDRFIELSGRTGLRDKTFAAAFPAVVGGQLHALLQQVQANGESYHADELRLPEINADRYLRLSLEPLCGIDGAADGVVLTAVDVTEHVVARKKLECAHDERETVLAALQDANRNKDQFLAMLGHELRNPLAPILMALEMMEMRADAGPGPERAVIRRQVDHLVRLVDDLLDIARVTQGKVSLKRARLGLRPLLDKAVEIASADIRARAHQLELTVGGSWYVEADDVRLAQVIANLLINAARYTPRGGIIRLSAQAMDGHVRIAVADNGRGMTAEELRQVFDLFYQGERGIDRAEGGLGVGLSLARRLVELHGGHIEARSDGRGRGSEFVVCLPSCGAPEAQAAGHSLQGQPQGRRILLVDDNVDAVRMLGMLLEQHGCKVEVCHDPVTALARFDTLRPDVAVLDIGLPIMSGHELAREIRQRPGGAQCRLIALSGYGQPEDMARSLAAGFELHLVKPVQPERLLNILQTGMAPP
ncbi:hybrid sensor histidine kinase/response regulator [Pseudoduganella chitinolytica]|uniref:histidine kinase n=1 Tax=Pseudoduganella chitinolytica TaxID=34070 RepID=A0ABY8BFI5_9BURK|nr:ATP-binding protein [Pseudoduganella chitinolytica]WEF33487.1 ATP-binding protein [Pseudoduganella chitinolytica]